MATDTSRGFVTLWEDFLVDNGSTDNAPFYETTASGAAQDLSGAHGGWWRQTTSGTATHDAMLASELAWEADEGSPIVYETRVKSSAVSNICISTGMTNANTETNGIAPIESEDGTLASTADNVFAFLLDEASAGTMDLTWVAVGSQATTDKTSDALTEFADAVAATAQTLRMEAFTRNSGTVYYQVKGGTGGSQPNSQVQKKEWFLSSVVFCPYVCMNDRGTAATVDWDYIFVQAPRS